MTVQTPAVVSHFSVVVDVHAGGRTDLGAFMECSGLSAAFELTDLREGGENGFLHKLWGPVSYGNVTLARPVDEVSATVAAWVSSFEDDFAPTTARIEALDPAGEAIAAWSLREVVPASWSGPSWSASGAAVAKETLVLAHGGFTTEGP